MPQVRINRQKILDTVGFQPHAGQKDIFYDDARFRTVAAGRRFGKSEIGGHRLTVTAYEAYTQVARLTEAGKRMEYWIVGPEYSDAEKEFRILWNDIERLGIPLDKPGSYNDPNGGNMHISAFKGKWQVHAKSAKHPETLVGEGLHGVVVAEAAKIKERVWTKFVRPTLNDFKGWALLTSTPEGKNWFYQAYLRGMDPNQEAWRSWRRPSWMNPHVYPLGATDEQIALMRKRIEAKLPAGVVYQEEIGIDREVAQLLLDLTEPTFNQEIGASFNEFVGRVFSDFDDEVHVSDLKYNPRWETYAAVDYGFTNPNVWLLIQVDPHHERIYVLDEVYETGLSPEEFALEIQRRGLNPSGLRMFYPDPASPGDTRVLEQKLRVKGGSGTGGEIKWRIDSIRDALKDRNPHLPEGHVDRFPSLLFDRKCVNTIRDMNEYRYPDRKDEQNKNAPELPMKKNDHGPEALGRFFAGHFGTKATKARRARQSKAEVTR